MLMLSRACCQWIFSIKKKKKLKDPSLCYLGCLGILALEGQRAEIRGGKGKACHNMEDVQRSLRRGKEEGRDAGQAQGCSESPRMQ